MYKKVVILLIPILLLIPSVFAEQKCDGNLCLTYNNTYLDGTYDTFFYLDTNDTSNTSPNLFLSYYAGDKVYHVNSTFNTVQTITMSSNPSTHGYAWYNDSGTEKFLGSKIQTGTDYFRQYFLNGTYHQSYAIPDQSAGCDWYNNNFYCVDEGEDRVERYNMTMDLIDTCSYSGLGISEPHHSETQANYIYILTGDDLDESIVLLNYVSCTELGRIYLGDFAVVSGVSGLDPKGIVANYDDSKVWVYLHYTDSTNDILVEFDTSITSTESVLTPTNPTEGDSFTDTNIVMTMILTAGLTGNLTCYVDDVLTYTNNSMSATTHYVEFPSGTLADGSHTWYCNYTDTDTNVWEFDDTINFDTNTGVGVTIGEGIAEVFGFADDDLGTSSDKGLAFVSLILALAMGVGVAITTQSAPMGSIGIMGGLLIFTFIGWLPVWIGIVLIVIAGLIVMKTFNSAF